jgi:alkylation response protein AidB-like acyl-CoA dehydrogenase
MGSRSPRDQAELVRWQSWTEALHVAGLGQMAFPIEHGGAGASTRSCLAVDAVLAAAGMPEPLSDLGMSLVGPAILQFGTDVQKQRHLAGIADGSVIWTQLFSEPDAGSDLASLRARAEPTSGGGWSITGRKTWNTMAHVAEWGFLLARTGSVSERHRGLSAFLVPMDAHGVEVFPIREMTGTHDFNEVSLDNVTLPALALLGRAGQGWEICNSLLEDERRASGKLALRLESEARRLCSVLVESGGTEPLLGRLGEALAGIEAATQLALLADQTESEALAIKILFSELNVVLHQIALDALVEIGASIPPPWHERWEDGYLYTRAYTIAAGANEILRNSYAKRILGLPSSGPKPSTGASDGR